MFIIYVLCLLINQLKGQTAYCGGTYYGSLSYSSDYDTYSITLSSSYTWITVSTCNSDFDTEVELMDSSYNYLCGCDDCGDCYTSLHEQMTYSSYSGFSYGTYRIRVKPHSSEYGSYILSVTCGSSSVSAPAPTYCYAPSPTVPTSNCPSYSPYECDYTTECIPSSWVCDDYEDCDYGDDEDDCYSSSSSATTYTWVFVVIGFIVVACIVYVVWYQNKQKRKNLNPAAAKANVTPASPAKSPVVMQPSANIKYVDQNGNPVAPPTGGSNIKYVDQNGNPVAPPSASPNIKYVDQFGNPVAPPTNQPQVIQPAPTIKYVDQYGNPVPAPTGALQQVTSQPAQQPQPQPVQAQAPPPVYSPQQSPQPVQVQQPPPPGYSQPGEDTAPPAYAPGPEADAPPPAYSNVMGDTASAPPAYQE